MKFDRHLPLVSQLNVTRWNVYIQQSLKIVERLNSIIPVPQEDIDVVTDLCSILPNNEKTDSFYKILMPLNKDKIAINLRLSNHQSGAEENWFKHELSGKPNKRISIFFGDADSKPTDTIMSDGVHLFEIQFSQKHLTIENERKAIIETIIGIFTNGKYRHPQLSRNTSFQENKQYKTITNMNKKLIRLTESDLHKIITESVKRVLKESQVKKDVFTISAFDIENEEDVSDMQYCAKTYYDINDAIASATKFAQSLVDYGKVVMVTVYAGEYETDNGNIFGEPYDVYTISNSDKKTTAIARKQCGYVSLNVDAYAV